DVLYFAGNGRLMAVDRTTSEMSMAGGYERWGRTGIAIQGDALFVGTSNYDEQGYVLTFDISDRHKPVQTGRTLVLPGAMLSRVVSVGPHTLIGLSPYSDTADLVVI